MHKSYLHLLQALDPLFPIGSFTLSGGLETYVQKELVSSKATLLAFLEGYLYTLPTNDLGFGAKAALGESVVELDALCGASKSPIELRRGSQKQCTRFLKMQLQLGDYPQLAQYATQIQAGKCLGYFPVAVGLLIRDLALEVSLGLELYGYSLLSAMVNHGVKLVPLGQLEGQQCLAACMVHLPNAAQKAIQTPVMELGIGGAGFDLRAMQHETLYSRLYSS